jgi:AraC-like DNA-binding protein
MAAASSLYPRAEVVQRACARHESGFGPKHANGWYELSWLERGTLAFRYGKCELVLRPGDCALLPPDVENTPFVQGASVHQTWIAPQLVEHACAALGSHERQVRTPLLLAPDAAVNALGRGLFLRAQAGWSSDDPGQAAALDAIAIALVAPAPSAFGRSSATVASPLRAALDLIASQYAQRLDVDTLAHAAGMNRFSFMRAFRATFGDSPYRYLLSYRLERAAAALRTRNASVLEVALACGFDDPSRFSRMFRARFGCSPSRYQRQARR